MVIQKSFSMASPNSSHTQVFASAIAAHRLIPVCCLRSPISQKGPIGLLQLDSIPYCRCPPAGAGVAATTGTNHLEATAPVGCLDDRSTEDGPLGLNVPCLPGDMNEALPKIGVETPPDGEVSQALKLGRMFWVCQVSLASFLPGGGRLKATLTCSVIYQMTIQWSPSLHFSTNVCSSQMLMLRKKLQYTQNVSGKANMITTN